MFIFDGKLKEDSVKSPSMSPLTAVWSVNAFPELHVLLDTGPRKWHNPVCPSHWIPCLCWTQSSVLSVHFEFIFCSLLGTGPSLGIFLFCKNITCSDDAISEAQKFTKLKN